MKNKKSQINQVFVYLFSTIIILFCGFLVVKFILSFSNDVEDKKLNDFQKQIKRDYKSVYTTYSSEKTFNYNIGDKIKKICFLTKIECINNNLFDDLILINETKKLFLSKENIVLYDKNGIYKSYKLDNFYTKKNNGCFCINTTIGRFDVFFENIKNKVYIS